MIYKASPNKLKELYKSKLNQISEVNFTFRQIDVLACLLHKRNYGKIADILDIKSVRTVQSHIGDIRKKLNDMSVEDVIDFIDKSGARTYLTEYYFHLLAQYHFENKLKLVKKTFNPRLLECNFDLKSFRKVDSVFIDRIKRHLKLANIKLSDTNSIDHSNINIKMIDEESTEIPSSNSIFLIFDDELYKNISEKNSSINFSFEDNYYSSFFKLLSLISNNQSIDKMSQEFDSEIILLGNSWKGISTSSNKIKFNKNKSISSRKKILIWLFISLFFILTFTSYIIFLNEKSIDLEKLNSDITKFSKVISTDNMRRESREKNDEIFLKLESLANKFNNTKVIKHFTGKEVSNKHLLDCLCVLQSLGGKYNDRHNGYKALKILHIAKKIAENYLNARKVIKLNFKQMDDQEIYDEFINSDIKHLPELYTRIIYMIGRCYVYSGDITKSKPYFILAGKLGNKLNLYEGYASKMSGLNIIKLSEITNHISSNNKLEATNKILKLIYLLEDQLNNNKEYKIDYNHNKQKQRIMIPTNDTIARFLIYQKLINLYNKLLSITDDRNNNNSYILKLKKHIIKNSKNKHTCLALLNNIEINQKNKSKLLNTLSFTLLTIYKKDIVDMDIFNSIRKNLSIEETKPLKIIRELFNLSIENSSKSDYTKADAYDGIIEVNKLQLNHNIADIEKLQINQKIDELTKKRDEINKALKRDGWRSQIYK